jgi:tetratricopeptide (TPR) repeat protein
VTAAASPLAPALRRVLPLLLAVAVACLALLAHAPGLDNGFTNYDDEEYVTANPMVPEGLTRDNVAFAFSSLEVANWHPLTWLSYMLDADLSGADGISARVFHRTSLALHALNAALLLLFLLAATGAPWRSLAAAALFAVHPLHVESVAWVSERKDVLFLCFGLLALLAYVRYARRPGPGRWLLVAACMALGLMAKPMLVTLPALLLLLDFWPLGRTAFASPGESGEEGNGVDGPVPRCGARTSPALRRLMEDARRLVPEKLPLAALSLASAWVTMVAQSRGGAVASMEQADPALRAANALVSYVAYAAKLLAPHDLAVFYPLPADAPLWQGAGCAVLLGWALWAAWRLRRKVPALLFGLLWYLVALLPVIGLVQVGRQAMADRYAYLPCIGLYVALAWGTGALLARRGGTEAGSRARRGAAAAVLLGAALAVLLPLTRAQTGVWKDSRTLFAHAIEATHHSPEAYVAAGYEFYEDGDPESALELFRQGLERDPNHRQTLHMISLALLQEGSLDEAEEYARRILKRTPGYAEARNTLGVVAFKRRDYAGAVAEFQRAVDLDPKDETKTANLDRARRALAKWEQLQGRLGLAPATP